jgi:hypothetical protein
MGSFRFIFPLTFLYILGLNFSIWVVFNLPGPYIAETVWHVAILSFVVAFLLSIPCDAFCESKRKL